MRSVKTQLRTIAAALAASLALQAEGAEFSIGKTNFLLDGRPIQIRCGEIHAARVPREYWRHRLQMAKAMGLNTICAYLFWNQVEPERGKFDWTGQADGAEFCRIAQQEGLWVILRPGPYSCAEWEMGGMPWWLLKEEGIKFRTSDPRFMTAATNYLREVGKQFAPLQITRGGPILMTQVENEYGSFGNDPAYVGELRRAMIDVGFDVPLFACNPAPDLKNGYRSDLFPVVNFGSNPAKSFAALREILPQGPLMCGEFYPGWFDTWGQPHHLGNTPQYLADLAYMLTNGASFSIYMVHGGTTFGLWAGADQPYKPDTSSYDYDAPISEAGWPTSKYYQTRELFSQHLSPGEVLTAVPPTNAVITFAPVEALESAPIFANLPGAVADASPRPMEQYNQAQGCILYRTTIPAGPPALLETATVHDFGFVYLDGKRVAIMDRMTNLFTAPLPARENPATLDILVEAMGRVNFGKNFTDRKGLGAPVKLAGVELTHWKIFNLPLDDKSLAHLKFSKTRTDGPAFWRAQVNLPTSGDTFLDLRPWGKGVAWINGHCLGRFWNIGPTQSMYAPGPWLKAGEILILDLLGPERPVVGASDNRSWMSFIPKKPWP